MLVIPLNSSVCYNTQENEDFLTWCLDSEMSKVHAASGDSNDFLPGNTDRNLIDCLASSIWKSLGHPDKQIRWKASHTILRYCFVGNAAIVFKISEKYCDVINSDYLDGDSANYFFIDSAKLWFLITCMRISCEWPDLLFPLYSFFKEIACAESISHALIRRAAKRICLLLAPHCAPNDTQDILNCDKISLNISKRIPRYAREQSVMDCKFDFDETDTLRYWYDDLAELFACSQADVAKECDYFISLYGIDNQTTRNWRNRYLQNVDYHKTSNGHGSIPLFETLGKYAEWHSMFYVADKFRITKEVVDDEYPTFEGWIDSYLPHLQGYWGNEFRNHIPYIPFLWEFEKTVSTDAEPVYLIPEGLPESLVERNGKVTLSMESAKDFEQSVQHIGVRSALVKDNQLTDLISALRKPHSVLSHYYRDIDGISFGDGVDLEIEQTAIDITSFRDNALDMQDALTKDLFSIARYLMGASDIISEYLGLSKQEQISFSRSYDNKQCAIEIYHWCEPEVESGYKKRSTHGHHVSMEKTTLLDMLKRLGYIIIFEVTISFEDKSYDFYGTPSKPARERALCVLRANESKEWIAL